jgi:hypothetical protein
LIIPGRGIAVSEERLHAVDILDWDYLCAIAENLEPSELRTWNHGLRYFASQFTSTGNVVEQDRLLRDLLRNSTAHMSSESAEAVVVALARDTHADREQLCKFAKQSGVRLRRG